MIVAIKVKMIHKTSFIIPIFHANQLIKSNIKILYIN
jgi:hypothetical protein